MAESLILPNSTFSANNITTTGNVVISSALYLGTTSLQVSVSTGGVNANVYSAGSLVRQGYAPTYVELSTAPSVAAEGDKWWSTSNSLPFRYLSGGWRKLVPVVVVPALYEFTNATFNTGGAGGRNGPILSEMRSGLTGTPAPSAWYNTYLNMTTQGYQLWTVPATGTYTVDAYGARGGGQGGVTFGLGARIQDTFVLTAGEVIRIVVGQVGTSQANASGGGGCTSIVRSPYNTNASILIIAAGGGGSESNPSGANSRAYGDGDISNSGRGGIPPVDSSGSGAGGINGNGGGTASGGNCGGGGGGFFTSGATNTNWNNGGGGAFTGDSLGGTGQYVGGFGGGGGAGGNGDGGGPGAGGGYSGGGGGDNVGGSIAGGGGSYTNGTGTSLIQTIGANSGAGYVTITKI